MKYFQISIFSMLLFTSCGDNEAMSQKQLELKEKELELRQRELELEKNMFTDNITSKNTNSGNSNSRVGASVNNDNSSSVSRNINSDVRSATREKTEKELRNELYNNEIKNPKNYLSVEYDLTYKVFSGEDKITGSIINLANFATFSDIVLTVTYSTATETILGTKDYVVYDYVYPGSILPFTIKTYSPEGTKKIGVNIKTAKSE